MDASELDDGGHLMEAATVLAVQQLENMCISYKLYTKGRCQTKQDSLHHMKYARLTKAVCTTSQCKTDI